MDRIRKEVLHATKLRSLTFRPKALRLLVDFLGDQQREGFDVNTDFSVFLAAATKNLSGSVIDVTAVEGAVAVVLESRLGGRDDEVPFEIVDVFSVPKFRYDQYEKRFMEDDGTRATRVDPKTAMLNERYQLVYQRMLRSPQFCTEEEARTSKASGAHHGGERRIQLTALGSLLGSEGSKVVFGMLSKSERSTVDAHGQRTPMWVLEDHSSRVELAITDETKSGGGMITEGGCLLADGIFADGVFHVHAFAHPPAEPREQTMEFLAGANLFGGETEAASVDKDSPALEAELQRIFVVLSDVNLDKPLVMEKLRLLLEGYSCMEPRPSCFVLMGNFLSQPVGGSAPGKGLDMRTVTEHFNTLGDLLASFPLLVRDSEFLLVPGPNDPGPAPGLVPRPALPACFTQGLLERVPGARLCSNPCRLHYCGKQLVFFRDDLMHRMRRACVIAPEVSDSVCEHHHLCKALLDQSTLCPLPLHVRPVHWKADHALHLFPAPHLVVCADRAARFSVPAEGDGCGVFNPGSFPVDFSFFAYTPGNGHIEPCRLP